MLGTKKITINSKDVPGIGDKTEAKLKKIGINTIQDLLDCNVKTVATQIDRVGVASLNKCKQNARQILKD